MGCVVAKPSMNSMEPQGLEKLKLENGYVRGDGGFGGARRSTGQRPLNRDPTRVPRTSSALGGARGSGAGRGGGDKKLVNGDSGSSGGQKEKMVTRDSGSGGGGSGGGGRRSGRLKVVEEVVDGWPKWLSDNIPKEALAGLVPRSADSYEMLDKVCFPFTNFLFFFVNSSISL